MISTHSASAEVYQGDILIGELDVKSGSFSMDEKRAPYMQATLTVPTPSYELMDALDPRVLTRIDLTLTREHDGRLPLAAFTGRYAGSGGFASVSRDFPGRSSTLQDVSAAFASGWNGLPSPSPISLTVRLVLLSVMEDFARDEVVLELASAEVMLMQDAASGTSVYHPGAVPLAQVVQDVLTATFGGYVLTTSEQFPNVDAEASEWKPGVTAWDYLRTLVEQAGARLWADEQGFFQLRRGPVRGIRHEWAAALAKTLTRSTSRATSWGDAVIVIYEWDDADGNSQTRVDYAKDVANPTRPRVYRRDSPYPGPGAAASLLRFVRTRGRDVEYSAISDYSVAPGNIASITFMDSTNLAKVVASVDFSIGSDEMQVTLRDELAEGEQS
ncbi:hypothetical protein [Rathayibacter sp. AY1B5]|uniref:hypothetical protein n=1 Tax=Rathayibacter sp. AY1B5 TaxID=2080530 RepID=UPI000CE9095C|nr:hypothetical protein [Rathayibacter sp. AY1B5]PPI28206.1 hypothetical protein C5D44_00255 [Rathayibacter sp. AY1B5]